MKRAATIGLCVFLMFSSGFVLFDVDEEVEGKEIIQNGIQYTVREPISIHKNSDFTPANGVSGGSGSQFDPWIIENYEINGTDSGHCIYVGNVTDYFQIQHCYLHDLSDMSDDSWLDWYALIVIQNATHGKVYNNSIEIPHFSGIRIEGSTNITIQDNFLCSQYADDEAYCGIYIFQSNYIISSDNSINVYSFGITVDGSNYNTIERNFIINSTYGLHIGANSVSIENNTFKNNSQGGIYLFGKNHIIRNNTFNKSGILFGGYTSEEWGTQTIDLTNLVNGNPIYYIKNQINGNAPSDAGQLILVGCNGVTIEDLSYHNTTAGIQMYACSMNTIRRITLKENRYGIRLHSSGSNNLLLDSIIIGNHYGINILSSDYNYISNTTISNNAVCGILATGSEVSIKNNRIYGNGNLSDSYEPYQHGVYISDSTNSIVKNNDISYNIIGIELSGCESLVFQDNTLVDDGLVIRGGELIEWNSHDIDSSNIVNGGSLEYRVNQTSVMIPQGTGQIILVNCSEMLIVNEDVSKSSCGLQFGYCNNITINNVKSDYCWEGAFIWHSSNITIGNSTFSYNDCFGFCAYTSNNLTFKNSNFSHNSRFGIYASKSHNSEINNCQFYYNDNVANRYGGGGVSFYGNNLSITYSIFYGNDGKGLSLRGYHPRVENCDVRYFSYGQPGLFAYSVFNGVFTNNIFYKAMFSIFGTGNLIYGNVFVDDMYLATDYSEFNSNSWDNGYPMGGNYWSDYTGYDNYSGPDQDQPGSDGIGDTNRTINSGSAHTYNVDNYPIMLPFIDLEPPESSVSQMSYFHNSPVNISANASDEYSDIRDVTLLYKFSVNNASENGYDDWKNWTNWTSFGMDDKSPWSWYFDFPNGEGYYLFTTIANDTENNSDAQKYSPWYYLEAKCAYNHTPPSIILTSPQNNTVIKPGTIIDFEITDDNIDIVNFSIGYQWTTLWSPYNVSTDHWQDGLVTLEIKAKDKYGNKMHKIYSFTIDGTGPSIISTSPVDNEINVLINTTIEITFSEPINITTAEGEIIISDSNFNLLISNYSWSSNNMNLSITLLNPLDYDIEYRVLIRPTISDEYGNYMTNEYELSFTTWLDTDEDGIPDSEDDDDDNDGFLDEWEDYLGTDPKNQDDRPLDTDEDGIPDGDENNTQEWMDTDDDNDGVNDPDDYDPLDPNVQSKPGLSLYEWVLLISILVLVVLVVIYFIIKTKPQKTPEEPPEESPEEEQSD